MEFLDATFVAVAVTLATLTGAACKRLHMPALVGYLLLGFLFRLADARWGVLTPSDRDAFSFLGHIGFVVLLFVVGLKSDAAMIVVEQARQLGPNVVSSAIYAAIVFVVITTSVIAPLTWRRLLEYWPQSARPGGTG